MTTEKSPRRLILQVLVKEGMRTTQELIDDTGITPHRRLVDNVSQARKDGLIESVRAVRRAIVCACDRDGQRNTPVPPGGRTHSELVIAAAGRRIRRSAAVPSDRKSLVRGPEKRAAPQSPRFGRCWKRTRGLLK